MSRRVVLTGASGFIGNNVLADLLRRGDQVVAVDRRPGARRDPQLTWVEADIRDADAMRRAFTDADLVIHLAAVVTLKAHDPEAWEVNTDGVQTVARAALEVGVPRLVHCSSVHAYDQRAGWLDENSARSEAPELGLYDRSKWVGEQRLQEVIADGLDAVICNPTGTIGPNDPHLTRLNRVIREGAAGHIPVITTGGYQFVDARDVASGLLLAAEHGLRGHNYLMGGQWWELADLIKQSVELAGPHREVGTLPVDWVRRMSLLLDVPLQRIAGLDVLSPSTFVSLASAPVLDCSKASRELGWMARPARVTLVETVHDLIAAGYLTPASARR